MMALLWLMHSQRGEKVLPPGHSGIPVGRFNIGFTPVSVEPSGLSSFIGHGTQQLSRAKTGTVLGKLGWWITLAQAQTERSSRGGPARGAWNQGISKVTRRNRVPVLPSRLPQSCWSHLIHLVKVQGRPQPPGVLLVAPLDSSFAGIQIARL